MIKEQGWEIGTASREKILCR